MTVQNQGQRAALVEEFIQAYNAVDVEALERLLAEDIHWEHHNHFAGDGRDGLIESIRRIADILPGRVFSPPVRGAEVGDVVYREQVWSGTPTEKMEGFDWEPGVPTSMDGLSVFVFRDDQIIEWSDYA